MPFTGKTPAINVIWIKLIICPFSTHWWLWAGIPGISYSHTHGPSILHLPSMHLWQISTHVFSKDTYLCHVTSSLITMAESAVLKHCPANLQFGKFEGLTLFDDSKKRYQLLSIENTKAIVWNLSLSWTTYGVIWWALWKLFMLNVSVWATEVTTTLHILLNSAWIHNEKKGFWGQWDWWSKV